MMQVIILGLELVRILVLVQYGSGWLESTRIGSDTMVGYLRYVFRKAVSNL